ncbi:MAG TPA: prepilin-type N-terminal cleavage/methylation domain-containing protein [Acidobacteriota bacterium]|nr:prepilin-type N-terminal cleavage/methylation domain-containing protein [Acidobacteriota bacterium]
MADKKAWAGRTRRTGARRRGLGLIEVLIVMALVLVLVVGAAEMLALALGAKRKGDVAAALTHALTDRLEALKSLPFDAPELAAGEYEAAGRVEPGACLVASTWRIDDEGGAKRITLRVRYAGRPGPATTAIAFVLRDLGFGP